MVKAGIQRVIITDEVTGRGAGRFKDARLHYPAATKLHRHIFDGRGMPLLPGYEEIRCTLDEFKAGYDYELGIDVIFNFTNGMSLTMQEKFLLTKYKTATVEFMQNPRTKEEGDWFNMKAQLYFVGYDRRERVRAYSKLYCDLGHEHNNLFLTAQKLGVPLAKIEEAMQEDYNFQDWILLNWAAVVMETLRGNIVWDIKPNTKDGARANFKYAPFTEFPDSCIVAERDDARNWNSG